MFERAVRRCILYRSTCGHKRLNGLSLLAMNDSLLSTETGHEKPCTGTLMYNIKLAIHKCNNSLIPNRRDVPEYKT